MSYEDIYSLKPKFEIEPGWWKLAWRPLWKKTISASIRRNREWDPRGVGFRTYDGSASNGWGRSFRQVNVEILGWFFTIFFWVRWNYIVMAEGPSDIEPRRPLELPT